MEEERKALSTAFAAASAAISDLSSLKALFGRVAANDPPLPSLEPPTSEVLEMSVLPPEAWIAPPYWA